MQLQIALDLKLENGYVHFLLSQFLKILRRSKSNFVLGFQGQKLKYTTGIIMIPLAMEDKFISEKMLFYW